MKIVVVGGDKRYIYLTAILRERGHIVEHLFVDNATDYRESKILANCDGVILPVPICIDKVNLNTPLWSGEMPLLSFFALIPLNAVVVGGVVSSVVQEAGSATSLNIHDMMDWEELTIRNAIPTAEGAIDIAMQNTASTIFGRKCLVVGYGRIGKVLAKDLKGLGAEVTIASRCQEHMAWILADGYKGVTLADMPRIMSDFDIIFNTAPARVIGQKALRNTRHDALIIDLASLPGGVDFALAKKLGVHTIQALGLPGKIAPKSAGEYIADTVENFFIDET